MKIQWDHLCLNPSIPDTFFEEHFSRIYWKNISKNKGLPISFFEKHIEWREISKNKSIPLSFFEDYADKVDWHEIIFNKNLTEEFVEKHQKLINFWKLNSPNLSFSFFKKHKYASLENNQYVPISLCPQRHFHREITNRFTMQLFLERKVEVVSLIENDF